MFRRHSKVKAEETCKSIEKRASGIYVAPSGSGKKRNMCDVENITFSILNETFTVIKFLFIIMFPALLCSLMMLRLFVKLTAGRCRSRRDLTGKTVIVTGANSGIGKETARDLARRHARVILCCRSRERGEQAAEEIRASTGNANVQCKTCDLSSLKSVRNFAKDILQNEKRLDILINNAGIFPPPGRHLTEDGFEVTFASNHLGHFYLTNLLLPLLKKSEPSRIVVVSSWLYAFGKIELDNVNLEKKVFGQFWTYCNTKLANILFVRELNRRLEGTEVTVNALHPGIIRTGITRNGDWLWKYILPEIIHRFNKTAEEGAQTTIYLAVSDEVEGVSGKFFCDCKELGLFSKAEDDKMAKKLWDVCEEMTKISSERKIISCS